MKKILFTTTLLFSWAFNSQAVSYDEANWYVTVDVNQVRNNIVPLLPERDQSDHEFSFNEHLPQEVEQLSVYGHSEVENDLSLVINGQFAQFEINDYINSLLYMVDDKEGFDMVLFDTESHNGRLIEQYKATGENKSKSFYSTKVNDELIVLTLDINEAKNWIDNKYNSNELKHAGLISVLVNIESAMAHMGADLKSNRTSFNSAVFQKITQFSASVFQSGENLAIESALSTADTATAKQLEQVLNGLVAMNALSNLDNDNPFLSALAANLDISNQGNDLLLSSEFAMSLIPDMQID